MCGPRYGRKWRGLPWSQWQNLLKTPTIADLRALIEIYDEKSTVTFPGTLVKQTMVELAMVTLDKHSDNLNNEAVKEAFRVYSPEYAAELLALEGLDFISDKPITPDQLQLTYIREARTAIERFLRNVYRQDWQLDTGCLPYLPARPLSGRLITSDTTLQSLLSASSSNPGIGWLRVESRPNPAGGVEYSFSESGQIYPCRGRGPVWKLNSCALDCAIVAARLLNLGRTVGDKGHKSRADWWSDLEPLVQTFIKVVSQPWEGLDDVTSFAHRREFLNHFLKKYNDTNATGNRLTQIGDLLSAIGLWNLSTSGMMQMSFSTYACWKCSGCKAGHRKPDRPRKHQNLALLQLNDTLKARIGDRPSMSALLNEFFSMEERDCRDCKSKGTRSWWRCVDGNLPPRLAIFPDQGYRDVAGATSSSIEIRYLDTTGAANSATYRWLGGIYQSASHYRVYWNDCGLTKEHSNENNGALMVYDGLNLQGSIIGGVIPADLNAKVPPGWSKGADILFYERVVPNRQALQDAADSIKRGVDYILADQPKLSQTAQGNPVQTVQDDALQPVEQVNKRKRGNKELTSNKVQKT